MTSNRNTPTGKECCYNVHSIVHECIPGLKYEKRTKSLENIKILARTEANVILLADDEIDDINNLRKYSGSKLRVIQKMAEEALSDVKSPETATVSAANTKQPNFFVTLSGNLPSINTLLDEEQDNYNSCIDGISANPSGNRIQNAANILYDIDHRGMSKDGEIYRIERQMLWDNYLLTAKAVIDSDDKLRAVDDEDMHRISANFRYNYYEVFSISDIMNIIKKSGYTIVKSGE